MKKVAVIGSGIAGLTCAYKLRDQYQVVLYEANDYLGGHTHTHQIELEGQSISVDTGFIVYNDRTYPNFINLLNELGCTGKPTEMSFSVRDDAHNLEYNGHNLNTLFAQRRNLISPGFWQMVRDILRFNKLAKSLEGDEKDDLDHFMAKHNFSDRFRKQYLYPMAAAIWSSGDSAIGQFPIASLVEFFVNHGLVDLKNRPQWYVVDGGSNQYIEKMLPFLQDTRLSQPVRNVSRTDDSASVTTDSGTEQFDEVIFATHSDQALALLANPSEAEQEILGSIKYTPNTAYLHTDQTRLPRRRLAWASWNYLIDQNSNQDVARLTYNMNILQHIKTDTQVLVTLNDDSIDPNTIIKTISYAHPFYNQATSNAQKRHAEISGAHRTHYCGAYWFNGFHEDGVKSALRVCDQLGVS